jgi:hypothetical protein
MHVPYLHVAACVEHARGLETPQGHVHIVGTTAGLRALLHATLDALLSHRPRHRVTCAPTGAEAELRVEMVTEPRWHSLSPREEQHG